MGNRTIEHAIIYMHAHIEQCPYYSRLLPHVAALVLAAASSACAASSATLNIVELIEKNPITKLSQKYNNLLLEKVLSNVLIHFLYKLTYLQVLN